ncbi:MarR family winged helix-turn-helix transcriptional regulator [Spongiivirga citrea]|uniref:HTH marR-type domain-containing protein n=1 Tax=Spongiivirga citrea TaxID=1481457 RepID=A0A6M0CMC4_9FLAO|nr:hypothetical protein [Spongiivirga citrea]NER16607.1 hypothetical protein [Spongiivirga citrea]
MQHYNLRRYDGALLDRLTKIELIYRTVDEKDKRVKRATLTKKGIKTIEKVIGIRFNEAHDAIYCLSEREKAQLGQLLKKMMFALK